MNKSTEIIPDKEEFLDIFVKVRTLIQEGYKQTNIMSPENFCKLWVKYKDYLHIDMVTRDNPRAMSCFYQNYMFLKLLENNLDKNIQDEKANITNISFSKKIPLMETIWKEQEKARKINAN